MKYLKICGRIISVLAVFIFLTIFTQIGGIVFLVSYYLSYRWKLNRIKGLTLFLAIYLFCTVLAVPLIAPIFGRVALPIYGKLRPLNITTCLLNRHYVTPELKSSLLKISSRINTSYSGTYTQYLDANFPFINDFPLIPHLSHDDGRKIDLAFYYNNAKTGETTTSTPSWIGYGIYDGPKEYEVDFPKKCKNQGFWQYDAVSYIIPKWYANDYVVDVKRTSELVKMLSQDPSTHKIFIEPHLKSRWKLKRFDNVRYHGCHAVRHDDHIHWQVK